jgi:hypothetical protein
MTNLHRIRVAWEGTGVVGGGVSTFYSQGALAPVITALSTLYNSVLGAIPPVVVIKFPNTGETLDEVSGAVVGAWTHTPAITPKSGSGPAPYAAGVGGRIVWATGDVYRRRHVRGSTYLVPFSSNQFEADGTIAGSWVSGFNTALGVCVSACLGDLAIYSRPRTSTSNDGKAHTVTGASVADKTSWLVTRRT